MTTTATTQTPRRVAGTVRALVRPESNLLAYIRRHRTVRGVPKHVREFYTEYQPNTMLVGTSREF